MVKKMNIVFFDDSPRIADREELIKLFKKRKYCVTKFRRKKIVTLKKDFFVNNNFDAIIYHCSGREGVEVNQAKCDIKMLKEKSGKTKIIVVSAGSDFQTMAKKYTTYIETYSSLLSKIKK